MKIYEGIKMIKNYEVGKYENIKIWIDDRFK